MSKPSTRFSLPSLACLLFVIHCSLFTAMSQTSTATLSGTVEDQNSAAVAGAAITILNKATSFERTATTNESGSFTVPLLPPGKYSLIVRHEGFTAVEVPNIVLNVADQKSITVELKVGDASATVEVRPDENLVRTDGAVSTTIDRAFVGNMPLNGRSFSSLVLLTPGVTVTTSGLGDFGQFSANGQRASTNAISIDGVSANIGIASSISDASSLALAGAYPGSSAVGGTNNLVSIDALEEFKVQTSTYTADSGRQPGAQVQVVTRSGSNNYRGSLFEYLRNEAFDARNYFNTKPSPQSPIRQNHFGGTFSGPVFLPKMGDGGSSWYSGKDRTFFFFSYEGQRLQIPTNGSINVPSTRLRNITSIALQSIVNAFPLPTGPELTTNTSCTPSPENPQCSPSGKLFSGFAPFSYNISNPSNLDATSIRLDHALHKNISIFGRYNESPSDTSSVTIPTRFITGVVTRTLTLGSTWLFSSNLSNELRFNISKQKIKMERSLTSIGGAVPVPEDLLTNGYGGLGQAIIRIGSNLSNFTVGTSADSYQSQLNIVDNLTVNRGKHFLKFGVDFRRLSPLFGPQGTRTLQFTSESAFSTGRVSTYGITVRQEARPVFENFSAYAQDTWKPSNRLTLDLGLRWEFNPPPTESEGRMPLLVLGLSGSDVSNARLAPPGTPFYKTFYTAFAPRFGFAYQLRKSNSRETTVRGGFGIYYDLGNGGASSGWPFSASRPTQTNLLFPISESSAVPPIIAVPTTTGFSQDENLKLPYTLQWNVTVEQALGKRQKLSIAYVGAAGRRLLTTQSLNQQRRDPVTGALQPRPNPNFGALSVTYNGPSSDYHSLQTQYDARVTNGLRALVNYTWAHAIDEASSDIENRILDRGNASFDVRHNLSAAVHYDIPSWNFGTVVKDLLEDWSLDAIVHAQSGRPIDLTGFVAVVIDDVSVFARPNLVARVPVYIKDSSVPGGRRFNSNAFAPPPSLCLPLGSPTCVNTIVGNGSLGRNALRELPLYQTDIALSRRVRLNEHTGLQLKAEVFNIFNHPMFGGYGRDFTIPETFGVPALTLNTSLGGFSSIYQIGGPRSIQLSARLSF